MRAESIFKKLETLGLRGENEDITDVDVIGIKFYNIVLMLSVLVSTISFVLIYTFVTYGRSRLLFLYVFFVLIILLAFLMNSVGLYKVSLNIAMILGASVFMFYSLFILPKAGKITSMSYYLPKLILLFMFILGTILHLSLNSFIIVDLGIVALYFYIFDIVFDRLYGDEVMSFGYLDQLMFNIVGIMFLLAIVISFYVFMHLRRVYERKLLERTEMLGKNLEMVSSEKRMITQNISRAKLFQSFMLSDERIISRYFSGYFIVYEPIMYISGDFYYFCGRDNLLRVALADSVGHGVSAAFVSIYILSRLQFIMENKDYESPWQILDIIKRMYQGKSLPFEFQGLDVAVMFYEPEQRELRFCSDRISVYLVRRGELRVLHKAHQRKCTEDGKDFQAHRIKLEQGDRLYMFTDGVYDLFRLLARAGGSYKSFGDFLISLQAYDMEEQGKMLRRLIEVHGGRVPRDDITVLGFEV